MSIRVKKLCELEDELKGHLKRQDLFPIIGSGFTRGCKAGPKRDGCVPSGEDMKHYMREYLEVHGHPLSSDIPFAKVARYYDKFAEPADFWSYFKQNFIEVRLPEDRQQFLEVNWRFVYTLNLDDAIEKNSRYQSKVLPRRELQEDALKDDKCVFKLHGDADELIKYRRPQADGPNPNATLTLPDYVASLKTNEALLEKLSEDLSYSNALFIGCSLSDELDLLSVAQQLQDVPPRIQLNRYFVMKGEPDEFLEVDLADYGIDTVIVVDDWGTFYRDFSAMAATCGYVEEEELHGFQNLLCADAREEDSIDYLLHGKPLLDKEKRVVCYPYFFIHRDIEDRVLREMRTRRVQIIHGTRVSGKTYFLAGLLRQIRNRDTYYFDSRNQVDAPLLTRLLNLRRSVLFFDTNVLTLDAVKALLRADYDQLNVQELNVVLCINNSDREVLELVAYERKYRPEFDRKAQTYELSNSFSKTQGKKKNAQLGEVDALNQKLREEWKIPFDKNRTLLDNLLDLQKELCSTGETIFDHPLEMRSINTDRLCLLILLAQNEKITARELVQCRLTRESGKLQDDLRMTVEEDHRSLLSVNSIDSARYQIVCNAKVWLLGQLREIVKYSKFKSMVIDAFKRMAGAFLGNTRQFKRVEKLVKFDKLNEIFPNNKKMIVDIYQGLMPVLNESYQYYHQNAKCHLWGMSKDGYKEEELQKARTAALTALRMVEDELDVTPFLPREVAYAHVLNTLTIIYTKLCIMEKFENADIVDQTVDYFYRAVDCIANYDAMYDAKCRRRNVREESGGVLANWISEIVTKEVPMSMQSKEKMTRILAFWKDLDSK